MRTAIATREAVFAAADGFAAAGTAATVEKVRDRVGGGSYSTINALLGEWTAERRAESAKASELPADISALARDLAVKAAAEIYIRVSQAAALQVEAARGDAEDRISAAQDRVAEVLGEVARLEVAAETVEKQVEVLRTMAGDAQLRASNAEGQVLAHLAEIDRMRDALLVAQGAERLATSEAAEARGQIAALRAQVMDLTDRLAAAGVVRVN